RDVIRYGRFHLDSGTASGVANVVSPESLLQMREPAMPVPGTQLQMGRDWFVQDAAGERVFFHGGDTLGQHTDFVAIPEQGFALIVLTNGQGGGSAAAVAALNAALAQVPALARLVGQIGLTQSLIVPADAPTVTLPADEVDDYAGRYADPGVVITLAEKGEGLEGSTEMIEQPGSLQPALLPPAAPPAPVAFLAKDMGVTNGARLPFVRDAEGRIGWLSAGLCLLPRVDAEA
ncbi:MAG: serine hydrolase, partial [Chloroflexota bacterium]|nr:serine hydrolase [Chloroflexota bacterium]